MKDKSAAIIIDTGFSLASLRTARKILAVIDVPTGRVVTGSPFLNMASDADVLESFAYDPLNHGSLVLKSLMAVAPELPVVLVRAYDDNVRLIRTEFVSGKQTRPGWTEAYLIAVHLCRERGLASVANLSFGGYTHAHDGTGWESHCLAQETGADKPGHIVLAGAGTGDGTAIHASWKVDAGSFEEATAFQTCPTTYNFWCAADGNAPESNDWLLEVFLNGEKIAQEIAGNVQPNLWNNRKQVTVRVDGVGLVRIRTSRFWRFGGTALGGAADVFAAGAQNQPLASSESSESKDLIAEMATPPSVTRLDPLRFDCWVNQKEGTAFFLDHQDGMSIAEPAIFPHVIAVGLTRGDYAPDQDEPGAKPEVLLEGPGPVSFRLPEVTARVARFLAEDPALDVVAVRQMLTGREDA